MIQLRTVFPSVYIGVLFLSQKRYSVFLSLFFKKKSLDFVGISLQTLTRYDSSTWGTNGFKELIAYAKCNVISMKVNYALCLVFYFVLLKHEQR